MTRRLKVGISTCPNDTFAFHALLTGAVTIEGFELEFELADAEPVQLFAHRRVGVGGLRRRGRRGDVVAVVRPEDLHMVQAQRVVERPLGDGRDVRGIRRHIGACWARDPSSTSTPCRNPGSARACAKSPA